VNKLKTWGEIMVNKDWESLDNIQLGQFAKEYARKKFLSYGFIVSELIPRNAEFDFTVSHATGLSFEVKVKSVCRAKYIFFPKNQFLLRESLLAVLVLFYQPDLPELYLIPSKAWLQPNPLLVSYDYIGKESMPKWGVNLSKKNRVLLDRFLFYEMIQELRNAQKCI
jgi:hypothetical protein